MASNNLNHLDKTLRECYKFEMQWDLMPKAFHRMCSLFGKGLKQRETSIFLSFLLMISFCMGHATLEVHSFWTEPIIIWLASVLSTGRCKSAFHEFVAQILTDVGETVIQRGSEVKPMLLPHCTWDKLGDLIAESGGRSIGLYDELMSFFSSMNMYSSAKLQVSDTKEYQDFLMMYTGKSKTRETVTGNANFKMENTAFTIMGFTQPQAALPVIKDQANNSKGFTSRFLWYFPKPIFCTMRANMLSEEETEIASTFKKNFVQLLANLYIHGEKTFEVEKVEKITSVSVNPTKFTLSSEALTAFESIHDDWEINVCEKYPHDPFIGGIFSRGKSQILRLSVPIQILLSQLPNLIEEDNESDCDDSEQESQDNVDDEDGEQPETSTGNTDDVANEPEEEHPSEEEELQTVISTLSIDIAHSLVKLCLSQLCVLNDKSYVLNNTDEQDDGEICINEAKGISKLYKAILLSPGKIASFSILTYKGLFRRNDIDGVTGRPLLNSVLKGIQTLGLGMCETMNIPGNKSQVHFFVKCELPSKENGTELIAITKKLAQVGISLPEFITAYEDDGNESTRHMDDYKNRKENHATATPSKKRKLFE